MTIYSPVKIYDPEGKIHLEFDRNKCLTETIRGKTVLHIGCSDAPITKQRIMEGTLLHAILQEGAKEIVGIDLSEDGINVLREHGFKNVLIMNAEDIQLSGTFDAILAGDVLEHLNNPGLLLDRVGGLLNPDGEIVIGVPSALTFNNVKAWFLGREQVHADHTFYFSPKTLSALCSRFGFLPTKLVFTVQPAGSYESVVFVFLRKMILKLFKSMAPSIVMHFRKGEEVDKRVYWEWQ